jgi:hypothetical protein
MKSKLTSERRGHSPVSYNANKQHFNSNFYTYCTSFITQQHFILKYIGIITNKRSGEIIKEMITKRELEDIEEFLSKHSTLKAKKDNCMRYLRSTVSSSPAETSAIASSVEEEEGKEEEEKRNEKNATTTNASEETSASSVEEEEGKEEEEKRNEENATTTNSTSKETSASSVEEEGKEEEEEERNEEHVTTTNATSKETIAARINEEEDDSSSHSSEHSEHSEFEGSENSDNSEQSLLNIATPPARTDLNRTRATMHDPLPNFTQLTSEKKKYAMYIIITNVHCDQQSLYLMKIGVTRGAKNMLLRRYRTTLKYLAYHWCEGVEEVDLKALGYYDRAMKEALNNLPYLKKCVLEEEVLVKLKADLNANSFDLIEAEYLNTGELYEFVSTDQENNMEDSLISDLVNFFRDHSNNSTDYSENGKELIMRKIPKGLMDNLFCSDDEHMSLYESVLSQGHFHTYQASDDRADFPLTGLSVRNLCNALYKNLKEHTISCKDNKDRVGIDGRWELDIMWVGIGE